MIDSCISKKVASILRNRGREAVSLSQLGIGQSLDPDVLKKLHEEHPDCVLVTSDDHMPEDHKVLVSELRPTLAIVDPKVGKDYDQMTEEDEWKWEVCMRWAHRMQEQEPHSVRRYNDGGSYVWKKPRTPRMAPKRKKAVPPTGLASGDPVVPGEEELHEQEQLDFG